MYPLTAPLKSICVETVSDRRIGRVQGADGQDQGFAMEIKNTNPLQCVRKATRDLRTVLVAAWILAASCNSTVPTATSVNGHLVTGLARNGVVAFLGIDYAAPKRFQQAVPLLIDAPVIADTYGDVCPQPYYEGEAASWAPMSENCLNLNIWTPDPSANRLPVLAFIHGGGWIWGGGNDPVYDGSRLAAATNSIVVTFNYRLGAFGFNYFGSASETSFPDAGNLGIHDQLLALNWIQDHIASFGGDPGQVTVVGESAGSMSIGVLLSIPQGEGLFARALMQSGAVNTLRSTDLGAEMAQQLLTEADVTQAADLAAMPWEDLLAAEESFVDSLLFTDIAFGPVYGDDLLPETPTDLLTKRGSNTPTVFMGTTKNEASLWAVDNPLFKSVSPHTVNDLVPDLFLGRGATAIATYEELYPDKLPGDLTQQIFTDYMFRVPHVRLAERLEDLGINVYMYRFDWSGTEHGAVHAIELPFMFGWLDIWPDLLGDQAPQAVADDIQAAWGSFVHTGVPQLRGKAWSRYTRAQRNVGIFGTEPSFALDPDADIREIWDEIPFDSKTPRMTADLVNFGL